MFASQIGGFVSTYISNLYMCLSIQSCSIFLIQKLIQLLPRTNFDRLKNEQTTGVLVACNVRATTLKPYAIFKSIGKWNQDRTGGMSNADQIDCAYQLCTVLRAWHMTIFINCQCSAKQLMINHFNFKIHVGQTILLINKSTGMSNEFLPCRSNQLYTVKCNAPSMA